MLYYSYTIPKFGYTYLFKYSAPHLFVKVTYCSSKFILRYTVITYTFYIAHVRNALYSLFLYCVVCNGVPRS